MREITSIDELNAVIASEDAVIDFWAPWCGPCRIVSPIIEQVAESFPEILVAKCDIDAVNVPEDLQIMSIPAIIRFKSGNEDARVIGALPKTALLKKLNL